MSQITVRGQAQQAVMPTSAQVRVSVRSVDPQSAERALAAAGKRCAAIDAIVDAERADLVLSAVTSSLRTGQEYEHTGKGRQLIGHTATRTTSLTCKAYGPGLTTLMDAVGRMSDVTVSGPRWIVDSDAATWHDVRAAAAQDARQRAESYASGLSQRVGAVAWIAEPGLRLGDGGGSQSTTSARSAKRVASAGPGDDDQVPVAVSVEPIEISTTVEVAFELLTG